MDDVADVLMATGSDEKLVDVPTSLQHGKHKMPLGRYLRQNLRRRIGRSEKCPEEVLEQVRKELLPVRQAAFDASSSFAQKIVEENLGAILNLHAKHKIKTARGSL